MMNGLTRFFIQQGSSSDLRVSDQDAWYVVRQTWPGVTDALSRCEIETKCADREEAVELCELYNAPPEPLGALAKWSGVDYNTLVHAAKAKRLRAHKRGNTWMSTRRDVHEYKARTVLKPRSK